jgi:PsbP
MLFMGQETGRLIMKNTITLVGLAAFFSLAICPQLKADIIELPLYGFQIDLLDAAPDQSTPTTVIQTFLPATDGFAPNIIVQIQPYAGTMKDYAALTKKQFEQLKWKVLSDQQPNDNEWTVEYTGSLQDTELHFYARAVARDGKVYLITATARDSQWSTVGDTLRKHVASFQTKAAPSGTSTPRAGADS